MIPRLRLRISLPARKWLTGLSLVLAPGLLTVVLLRGCLGASPIDCCPVANDEVSYWLQIATFREAGFNGGYHSTNEQIAPAKFCHFDPRGPAYPVLYGLLARFLGWHLWSGPVFHLLWLAAATVAWFFACRHDLRQLAVGLVLVMTFWPCLLLLPSTMQEGLQFALAFLIAALIEYWILPSRSSPTGFIVVALAIAACAVVRLTWAFLLLPWLAFAVRDFSIRGRIAAGSAAVGLAVGLLFLTRWLNAPHRSGDGIGFIAWFLEQFAVSPQQACALFLDHAAWNFGNFALFRAGGRLEMLQRCTLIGLFLVIPIAVWRARHPGALESDTARRWVFAGLNLAPVTIAVILAYDVGDWRDYRVLSPHLLLALLVLAGGATWRWVVAISGVHLLFAPAFLTEYAAVHRPRVNWDRALVSTFQQEIRGVLHFDPNRSAWDNTILVTGNLVTYPLVAVPPGMGVNAIFKWSNLDHAPRSRYLLMSEQDTRALQSSVRLRPLLRTHMGLLSINVDSDSRQDTS
jgi:hypothetical protein